jgi:hypothetical protein
MSFLQEFAAPSSAGFEIAIVAATISILLGGMLFGVGLGFGLRRIRLLGAEEIGQGIISAAMVGAIFAFILLLDSTTASLVPETALPPCPGIENPSGSPYAFYACHLSSLELSLRGLSSSLSRTANIAGFAASLRISTGVISAQPFFALESASSSLSSESQGAQQLSSLAFAELSLADFIRSSAIAVFLPAGLILRTFFATRKLGAAAMAIAISAYAIYPLFFLYSFSISTSHESVSEAFFASDSFNQKFASLPLLDLDATSSVRDKVSEMSGGDFGSLVQETFAPAGRALASTRSDLLLYPLISFAISLVAALELYYFFSAPIFLPYAGAV